MIRPCPEAKASREPASSAWHMGQDPILAPDRFMAGARWAPDGARSSSR